MVSKTKFPIKSGEIESIFHAAGLGEAVNTMPLGAGEFSAVYEVETKKRSYVIKIAPSDSVPIMNLEKDLMKSELFWYGQIKDNTPIPVPEIVFSDFDRGIISAPYFIMENIQGKTLDQLKNPIKQEGEIESARMIGHIHNIRGERFGYVQNGLHENWYQAIRAMVGAALNDGAVKGKSSARGEKLMGYIERHKDLLAKAECCMVNFDLWPSNIIRMEKSPGYAWIDPERSFWGDPVADFVCLETFKSLEAKTASLAAHNSVSKIKITATPEERIRYGIALGYLALIMETEKFYRYSLAHMGWWRNIIASGLFFKNAFGILRQN